jgi:hypothetical protein
MEKKYVPRYFLWALGIPGDLVFIVFGLSWFTLYEEHIGIKSIGMAITLVGLVFLWLNIMLIRKDVVSKKRAGRSWFLTLFLMLTLVPEIGTILVLLVLEQGDWPFFWPFMLAWTIYCVVVFFWGIPLVLKAIRIDKKLAVIIGVLLLVFFAVVTTNAFIKQYRDDHDKHALLVRENCNKNMGAINSSVMQYEIENGVYPSSLDNMIPDFLRYDPSQYSWTTGCIYTLDTSVTPPRVVCSNGH